MLRPLLLLFLAIGIMSPLRAEDAAREGALPELAVTQLSDRTFSPLGLTALGIRGSEWKHAETKNFIYHFFHGFIAGPVATEAEFYYSVIAKDLERDTSQWERKSHIFIFEKPEDWAQFRTKAQLDPWTGGVHSGGDLFVLRNAEVKWKGNTLAHEITHLVVHRFFGSGVPLWLNEGYAEFAASKSYAAFWRARGYLARPKAQAVDPAKFLSLEQLTSAVSYPTQEEVVGTFYSESERLVRFLSGADKRGFGVFFDALAKGNRFDSALSKGFGSRFSRLDTLEREFKEYATKEHGTSIQD